MRIKKIFLLLILNFVFILSFSIFCGEVYSELFPGRLNIINEELNSWEEAERNHRTIIYESKPVGSRDRPDFLKKDPKENLGRIPKLKPEYTSPYNRLPKDMDPTRSSIRTRHNFETGYEISKIKYVEPGVMQDKGIMQSLFGNYTYRPKPADPLYLFNINTYKLEGKFGWGEVDYEAEAAEQAGVQLKGIDDYMIEVRSLLGKEKTNETNQTLIYSGLGYRYLNDDTGGMLTVVKGKGYYGYEREANYYYIPAGIEFTTQHEDSWTVKLNGEYDFLVYGRQISHLSDGSQFTGFTNDDIANDQNSGYGFRGSIKLIKESDAIDFCFEPFWRYWNISDSEVTDASVDGSVGSFIEPKNKSMEYGLRMATSF